MLTCTLSVCTGVFARAQTTTLCVQEVEIYLERWEVLGALVDVSVGRRKVTFSFLLSYTNINKGAQHYH